MRDEANFEHNMERLDVQFWIDRQGKVHKYMGDMYDEITSFHYEIAHTLFPDIKYPNSPDDYLSKAGWVLVGSTVYNTPIIHKRPTQAQINTLDRLELYDRLCFPHDGYMVNFDKYQLLMK